MIKAMADSQVSDTQNLTKQPETPWQNGPDRSADDELVLGEMSSSEDTDAKFVKEFKGIVERQADSAKFWVCFEDCMEMISLYEKLERNLKESREELEQANKLWREELRKWSGK